MMCVTSLSCTCQLYCYIVLTITCQLTLQFIPTWIQCINCSCTITPNSQCSLEDYERWQQYVKSHNGSDRNPMKFLCKSQLVLLCGHFINNTSRLSSSIWNHPYFINPELKLVVLHLEHFLPGITLTIYSNPGYRTQKDYIAAWDWYLWETLDPSSAWMHFFEIYQTFHVGRISMCQCFPGNTKSWDQVLAIFWPRSIRGPLSEDVINLMHQTMESVNVIYCVQLTPMLSIDSESLLEPVQSCQLTFWW